MSIKQTAFRLDEETQRLLSEMKQQTCMSYNSLTRLAIRELSKSQMLAALKIRGDVIKQLERKTSK